MCEMQRGLAQHMARYGGNVGSETWPFWIDLQVCSLSAQLLPAHAQLPDLLLARVVT